MFLCLFNGDALYGQRVEIRHCILTFLPSGYEHDRERERMGHRGRVRLRGRGGGGGERKREEEEERNGLKDQSNAHSFVDNYMGLVQDGNSA